MHDCFSMVQNKNNFNNDLLYHTNNEEISQNYSTGNKFNLNIIEKDTKNPLDNISPSNNTNNQSNYNFGQKFIGDNYSGKNNQKNNSEIFQKPPKLNNDILNSSINKENFNNNFKNEENIYQYNTCNTDRPKFSNDINKNSMNLENVDNLTGSKEYSSQTLTLEDKINGLKQKISNFESRMNIIPQMSNTNNNILTNSMIINSTNNLEQQQNVNYM